MNIDEILNGAKTAFINQHNSSSADFTPKLLYNNRDSKVINSLEAVTSSSYPLRSSPWEE